MLYLHAWSYLTSEGFTLRGKHSPPSGKPLLHFLHGNGFCALTYAPLLELLSEHFDLWLSDAQGHGESDLGTEFVGWNRSAALALEAFAAGRQAFGQVPYYALGHSFGGVLTALMLDAEPGLFQRAVLLDPVLFTRKIMLVKGLMGALGMSQRIPMVQQALRRRQQWDSREAAYKALNGRGIYRGWDTAAMQAFIEHALRERVDGRVELCCPPAREAEVFSSSPRGLWKALRNIQMPTQIIHGTHSYPFVLQSAARAARINPCIERLVVPGGHCFMQEHPSPTAQQVLAFLQA